jgi:hypothetical protein
MVPVVGETGCIPGSVWNGMEERKSLFPTAFFKGVDYQIAYPSFIFLIILSPLKCMTV